MEITIKCKKDITAKDFIKKARQALRDAKANLKKPMGYVGYVVVMNTQNGTIASPFSFKDEFKVGEWMHPKNFISNDYNIAFTERDEKKAIAYADALINCEVYRAVLDEISEPIEGTNTGWVKHWGGVNIHRFQLIEPLND